jgi:hypothetical protein
MSRRGTAIAAMALDPGIPLAIVHDEGSARDDRHNDLGLPWQDHHSTNEER